MELKGKTFWTPLYRLQNRVKDNTYKNVISLIRVVSDLDVYYKPLAVERISINEDTVCSMYQDIDTYKDGNICLIDSSGLVLSSRDKSILGQNLKNEAYVKSIITSNKNEGFFRSKTQNSYFSILFYKLNSKDWYVLQSIPESEMIKQKFFINIYITISIFVCIIFGLLFSIIQNRSIILPLTRLSKEMGKVKMGDFNIKLDTKSNDEIGKIELAFIDMVTKLKEMIEKVFKTQIKEKEAQLIALESQINPHFLYNTLDSIHWLAIKNKDYEVSEQIEALSHLFKHVLNKGKEITTVGEEIEHLRDYIFLQKKKFGDRIDIGIKIDNALLNYNTLKLILQPLVENAYNHGLECKIGKGLIVITVERVEFNLKYTVEDNGIGTDEKRIEQMLSDSEESHNVFALKNINDRIKLQFGDEFGLKLYSTKSVGTKVEVLIPLITNDI
jgi:two-component system, sensor histidine kinase YesM